MLKKINILIIIISLLLAVSCTPQRIGGRGGVEFTDALGRELSIPHKPQRTAALLGSFAEIWQLAGGSLVASAEDAWDDFGLDMGNAVNIGGAHTPSLELLLSAMPDLVLASASTSSNIALLAPLEDAGVTVAYFEVDSFDDYLAMLKICTDITCREDLYIKNGSDIQATVETVKADYAALDVDPSQRKILLLRTSSGSVKAKGSEGTVLGEMLADIGCVNIADNDLSILEALSIEAIIREEPYHVFAVTMGSNTEAAIESLENLINGNSAWSSLSAIKNGRLHIMDKRLFNMKPNVRWAEAYTVLYETLTKE